MNQNDCTSAISSPQRSMTNLLQRRITVSVVQQALAVAVAAR